MEQDLFSDVVRLQERVAHLQADLDKVKDDYVKLERFIHVERIVLGISAAMLTGIGAILIPRLFGS